jgi:hypothetical protein
MRALLALALLATPALAEPRQHGNVVYDLPPDWSQGALERGAQILIYDGPEEACEFCYLHIAPGAPAAGDLAAWLAAESQRFIEKDERDSVEVIQAAEVTGTNPRPLAIMAQKVDSSIQVIFALEAGGRFEAITFEGWAYDEEEVARSLAFLQSDVSAWIDTFTYVSEGAAPLMPEAEPGGLSGLYYGWHQGTTVGLDMIMQITMEHRRLVFWPDGRFYDGTPPEGLQPLDPAALVGNADWGTYREGNGVLDLAYADGRTERLTAEGEGWQDANTVLLPVEPLADGTALDGTISSMFFSGFAPGSGLEGGISASSSTTFHPDGTFEGESFGGAFGSFAEGGGFSTGDEDVEGGTYEVRDGLVVMTPANGGPPTAEIAHMVEGDVLIGEQFLEE